MVEINREETLSLHLLDTHNSVYSGSVNITIVSYDKTDMLYFKNIPQEVSYNLFYQYFDTYQVQITASNEVSAVTKNISMKAVCKLSIA